MASIYSLSKELATCLAADVGQMWQCYLSSCTAEPMLAAHTKKNNDETNTHSKKLYEAGNLHQEINNTWPILESTNAKVSAKEYVETDVDTNQSLAYIADSLSNELNEQMKLVRACEAERKYIEMASTVKLLTSDKVQEELDPVVEIEEVVTHIKLDTEVRDDVGMDACGMGMEYENVAKEENNDSAQRHSDQVYLAESLVSELAVKKSLVQACMAEGKFTEKTIPVAPEMDLSEWIIVDAMVTTQSHRDQTYLAESLVSELAVMVSLERACMAEGRYVEKTTLTPSMDDPGITIGAGTQDEPSVGIKTGNQVVVLDAELETATESGVMDVDSTLGMGLTLQEESVPDADLDHKLSQSVLNITSFVPLTETADIGVNVVACTTQASTSTDTVAVTHEGTITDPPSLKEVGCNTALSCFDLMQRVKEMEELQFLKAEHQVVMTQMNKERSQRMVAEQLADIIQSDFSNLRERNVSETAMRMQLENELSDVKGELSFAERQLGEKEQRIAELEESLSGTSLLVRKLEEQTAVSLMSRGGIDYMLQAKLAEGRAQEAEQKLEITQTELLQSQGEVRRLLDRLSESSRDRSEMVSSRVHTQLIQIADEKAMMAERKVQELESEVRALRAQLALNDGARREPPYSSTLTGSTGYSGLTGLTGLSSGSGLGLFSSPTLGSTYSQYTSPYSLGSQTTQLPSLSDQYNLKSSMASSSSYLSEPTLGNGSAPFSYTGSSGTTGLLTNRTELKESHDTGEVNGNTLNELKLEDTTEKDVVTESPEDLQLPSFDLSTGADSTSPLVSRTERSDGNDSDSSDWSSSSDESGGGEGGEGGDSGSLVRPSHHTSLISEWEWRTTHDDTTTQDSNVPHPHATRRTPPPVAPKPYSVRRLPSTEDVILENPSSFDEPIHGAALQLLSKGLKRVKGPRGRSLPSRYRGKQTPLFS